MEKYEINKIIEEISNKQGGILSNIDKESIDVYLFLKKEYKKGNINNNLLFQFLFRSYYRLDNAGLSSKLKKRYFELLAKKEQDLTKILLELYKIHTLKGKNSVQFSFATKLLHTIDNKKPISDTEVLRVFHKNIPGKKLEKIKYCLRVY